MDLAYVHILLAFFLCLHYVNGETRTLTSTINPGCNGNCNDSTLIHIQSTGPDRCYHFCWAFFARKVAAFFAFETEPKAELVIDWNNVADTNNGSINFIKGAVLNAFAVEISSMRFINDSNNVLLYDIPLNKLEWDLTVTQNSSENIQVNFESKKMERKNGTLKIFLGIRNQDFQRQSSPPFWFCPLSSVLTDIDIFDFVEGNDDKANQPRLVSNFTLAFSGKNFIRAIERSIDDEYTPGVFQRYSVQFNSTGDSKAHSAFMEWRPVAYYDTVKTIDKSIQVLSFTDAIAKPVDHSTLNAYFVGNNNIFVEIQNNFGTPDEDFEYKKTPKILYSFVLGLNPIPEITISSWLKITIAVGLGVPMILFIVSIIYTIVRKVKTNGFRSLNNEETGN